MGGAPMEVSLAKPPSDKKKREEVLRNRERRMMQMFQSRAIYGREADYRLIGHLGPHPPLPHPPPALRGAGHPPRGPPHPHAHAGRAPIPPRPYGG